MRVVFAGTPPFAARALEALAAAGHEISLVLTQPDRPAGRGLRMSASVVAATAGEHGFDVFKPASLKQEEALARLQGTRPDAMVVAAYGLLLPPAVLAIPGLGCINIHASLLPRWRGAAPIQRAILADDGVTGVSIMKMDAGLDTGPVLLSREHAIAARETAGSLTAALAELGARAIVAALASIDSLAAHPQDDARATYAPKIAKGEARIDWTRSNLAIDRQVRAFDPVPGAEASFGGEVIKIWEAMPVAATGKPGEIVAVQAGRLVIACGEGALAVARVQKAGGKRLAVDDFLHGTRLERGTLADPAPSPA